MKANRRSWYCIYTKPKMEAIVGKQLIPDTLAPVRPGIAAIKVMNPDGQSAEMD